MTEQRLLSGQDVPALQRGPTLSRRSMLRWAIAAVNSVATVSLLSACRGAEPTPLPTATVVAGESPVPTVQAPIPTEPLPTPTVAAGPKRGGRLVVAITSQLQSLDPANHRDRVTETVLRCIFDGLVTRRPDGKIVPEIAESWQQVNPTEWEFRIRPNIVFHNGEPLTAETVRFSLERVAFEGKLDGETSPRRSLLPPIVAIETDGDLRVRIKLANPVPEAILLAGLVHNQIVPKNYVESVGSVGLAERPIGAGPFAFVQGTVEGPIILRRFEQYYGGSPDMPPVGPPLLDEVVFRVVPELSARLAALKAGEVHIAQGITPDALAQIENDPRIVVRSYPGTRTTWLAMNTTKAPFDRREVRQAMNYGLDVQAIIDRVLGGRAVRMRGAVPPFSQHFDARIQPYPFDPDRAKQLLAEAGLANGFQLIIDAAEADRSIVEIIAQQYRALGIDASVRIWEWPVLREAALKGERQMIFASWGNAFRHPVDLLNPTLMTGGRGNYALYSNPEVDRLLEEAAVASETEAARLYARIQQILYEDAPWVFLWIPDEIEAASSLVEGWQPGPDGRVLLADAWLASP